jgi:hypothetical protein
VRLPSYAFEDTQLQDAIERLLSAPQPLLGETSARLRQRPGTVRAADAIEQLPPNRR